MENKDKLDGRWWVPEAYRSRVHGGLSYGLDRTGTLRLTGLLPPHRNVSPFFPTAVPVILGLASTRQEITLINSRPSRIGPHLSVLEAQLTFIGKHFRSSEDIAFPSMDVEYTYLSEWSGRRVFEIRSPGNGLGVVIEYGHTEPVHLARIDGFEVSLHFDSSGVRLDVLEAAVKQRSYIRLTSSEGRYLDDFIVAAALIRDFLTFAIGEPVGIAQLTGLDTRAGQRARRVSVFGSLANNASSTKFIHPSEIGFSLPRIEARIQTLLENWFAKFGVNRPLRPVYELYFGLIYNDNLYLENQFLNAIQALEVYHRRTRDTVEAPEEEHRKRLQDILQSVPAPHKDWLEGKLQWSNEPTLRSRLRELLADLQPFISAFRQELGDLLEKKGRNDLINKAYNTRNYRTHYGEHSKGQSVEGVELWRLTTKLKMIVQLCLLAELGLSPDEVTGFSLQGGGMFAWQSRDEGS